MCKVTYIYVPLNFGFSALFVVFVVCFIRGCMSCFFLGEWYVFFFFFHFFPHLYLLLAILIPCSNTSSFNGLKPVHM